MAWRINETVVRGEIDNRVSGKIAGRIWLLRRDEPIALNLTGNCARDLGGCVVNFQNPLAKLTPDERVDLAAEQIGVAGDITASRKVRALDVPLEEALDLIKNGEKPPEHMGNCFYLRW